MRPHDPHRSWTSSLLLVVGLVTGAACATEQGGPAPGDGKSDHFDQPEIPTAGLKLLAGIEDQVQLEALFHAATVDPADTMGKVTKLLDDNAAAQLKIKGEGIPVFTELVGGIDLRLGSGLSRIARGIWSGKVFNFRRLEDGSLQTTLENAVLGVDIISANVSIKTLAQAMLDRDEAAPGAQLPKFGVDEVPVEVDDRPSVILDYELSSISLFSGLIDEIRPVTVEALAAAGIAAPAADVDLSNLWIGRATALFGFGQKQREFVLYFAVDFDLDSVEIIEPAQ
jgi:hypothetical protein